MTIAAYTAGAAAGGMVTAVALWLCSGLVSSVPAGARVAILGIAAAGSVLREAGVLVIRMPERRNLIPEAVAQKGFPTGPLQFGFEMGTGVRTFLPSSSAHVIAIAVVLLLPSFGEAASAGLGFGIGRTVILWQAYCTDHRKVLDSWLTSGATRTIRVGGASAAAFGTALLLACSVA